MQQEQPIWSERSRLLLMAAREISKELGHHEIICPLHLLLGLLVNVRPSSTAVMETAWHIIHAAISEFAPPWGDVMVLSPGGQTSTTKRILELAGYLADETEQVADVEHIWAALRECEPELVASVLCKLETERRKEIL